MNRSDVIAKLVEACQTITKANGFSTDAGLDVRTSARNIALPKADMVIVFAGDVQYGSWQGSEMMEKSLDAQVNVVLVGDQSEERISGLEVDLLTMLDQQAYEWGGTLSVEPLGLSPRAHEHHDLTEAIISLRLNYI